MVEITETNAFLAGCLAVLFVMLVVLGYMATQDDIAANQRAKRLSVAISAAVTFAIAGVVIASYLWGDRIFASFVTVPAVMSGLAVLLLWTPKLYRFYGGTTRPAKTNQQPQDSLPKQIDPETRQHQAEIRNALIGLPHFRETCEGDVISLITGDRIFWARYNGEPCLAIEWSGQNEVICIRFETLRRYLDIQRRISSLLIHETSNINNTL